MKITEGSGDIWQDLGIPTPTLEEIHQVRRDIMIKAILREMEMVPSLQARAIRSMNTYTDAQLVKLLDDSRNRRVLVKAWLDKNAARWAK